MTKKYHGCIIQPWKSDALCGTLTVPESRESGMEASVLLSREIDPGEVRYIVTLSDVGSVCSIVSLVFAVYVYIMSRKNK